MDIHNNPVLHDTNQEHADGLSKTEQICKRIADATGAPVALGLAIALQIVWIVVGVITKWDPFPFVFLLTCSNVLQLILIFVLAVGQRQSSAHAELRAEHDHDAISRLLYHQEVQEQILLAIAEKTQIDIASVKQMVQALASQDMPPNATA
ncbi:MAG: hypothetical protein NVSMB31_09580 [Vulcanimicrobiaceae bacterium]